MNNYDLMNNVEIQVSNIYLDYKSQIKYINDIDSAKQLMNLEYRKINNYLEGVIEEVKLDLYQEILKTYGMELAEKFDKYNFKNIEIKEYLLKPNDIYEEVIVKDNRNAKLKEVNHKKVINEKKDNNNMVLTGVLTLSGGAVGGTISNSIGKSILTGSIIGGITGFSLGMLFLVLNGKDNTTNTSNSSKIKEKKKLRFSSEKMINIINKREIETKKIIRDIILQITEKYNDFCRSI